MRKEIELKALQTKLKLAEKDLSDAKKEATYYNRQMSAAQVIVDNIKIEICKFEDKQKNLLLTEHALIRWLERKHLIDVEQIQNEIVTEKLQREHKVLGNGKFPIGDSLRAVIKDNVIVTIE